jgi:glycine cleavage system transcriptional repressor
VKKHFYFLSAVGSDRPGLVAKVSGVLFAAGCNLEDSSMMRLGSEFGMFAIFTANKPVLLSSIRKHSDFQKLFVDLKPISAREAKFVKARGASWIIRVHGADQPGLVYRVTACLAEHRFNITDLSTHRTQGAVPGYMLFIEGEPFARTTPRLSKALTGLAEKLQTHISFGPVADATL